jgi:CDP-diacylglycerol--glycerol-3-phosphate 3-phosphatidyltransferase
MNLPTKITVTRIVLVVLMLLGLFGLDIAYLCVPDMAIPVYGDSGINLVYLVACVIFVVAALTDKLDGDLARKRNEVTDLGKFLDPVADKLLVDSMLIYLMVPHFGLSSQVTIPMVCVIIMILRDLVVDALRFIAAGKGVVLAANVFGKIKTVAQMVAIPLVLLNGWPFIYFDSSWGYGRLCLVFVYIATLASLVSGIVYIVQNRSVLKEGQKHE